MLRSPRPLTTRPPQRATPPRNLLARAINAHPSPKTLSCGERPMLPAATVPALTIPTFTAAEFAPTQWDSAEDKAKFANALMKFIAHEFPRQSFTKPFYWRLSNTFGHIAHHNLDGFYGAFFERDADKVVFLEQTLSWPHFGDPTLTFSDVERAVKRQLRSAKVIDIFRLLEADATRRRELATLARLQEKYGAGAPPPDPAA